MFWLGLGLGFLLGGFIGVGVMCIMNISGK